MSSFITNADDDTNALTCSFAYGSVAVRPSTARRPKPPKTHRLSRIDAELGITEFVDAGANRARVIRMDGFKGVRVRRRGTTAGHATNADRPNLTLVTSPCIKAPPGERERIINYAATKLELPMDFFQLSIDHTGNTSAASLPMALGDAYNAGRIRRGDKVVLSSHSAAASPPARCCWKRKSASEHGRGMRYRPRPSVIDHKRNGPKAPFQLVIDVSYRLAGSKHSASA